jgi:hypothetical protein
VPNHFATGVACFQLDGPSAASLALAEDLLIIKIFVQIAEMNLVLGLCVQH